MLFFDNNIGPVKVEFISISPISEDLLDPPVWLFIKKITAFTSGKEFTVTEESKSQLKEIIKSIE